MGVDSRDKRMSMINIGSIDLMMGNPVNGVSSADMYMLLGLYSGISLSGLKLAPYYYLILMSGGGN